MSAKIKNTGDLRKFLCQAIVEVQSGDMAPDVASRITKLASQVNESFYSEIKVHKVMLESGNEASKLGDLPIGGN